MGFPWFFSFSSISSVTGTDREGKGSRASRPRACGDGCMDWIAILLRSGATRGNLRVKERK